MFRLEPSAVAQLDPESQHAAQLFLNALPHFMGRRLQRVRLFGSHALAFDLDAAFELLIEVDKRSVEVKTAVAIATSVVEAQDAARVAVTLVTAFERETASGLLARTLRNAEREGLDLWVSHRGEPLTETG